MSGFSFGTQASAPSGGFSFGNTANTTAPAGGNTSGGFSFGNKPSNSFSLGGTNTAQGATGTTSTTGGGFSFGNNNTATTTAANGSTGATGGGLFGNNNTASSGQGLFGNNNSGGGLFGNNTANTTNSATQAPAAGSSLFGGNSSAPRSSGFSFGGNNAATNTTASSGGSLFGNQQQQQQQQQPAPQPTASLNTQPSFSWSNQQSQQQSVHPMVVQAQKLNQQQSQQQNENGYTPTIADQLTKVKGSWDANSNQCLMKTFVYNKVPAEYNNYERPLDESAEDWENAMKLRPRGYNTIPVKIKGFEDLLNRSNLQIEHLRKSRVLLNNINTSLTNYGDKHDLDSLNRLTQCKIKQKQLNLKLLRIAINLTVLKYKGYQLTNDEEKLISQFKELVNSVDDPIGLNRSNELWARLSNLKQRLINMNISIESIDASMAVATNTDGAKTHVSNNEQVVNKIVSILSKQQQGIQYLYDLIENDKELVSKLANKRVK
ncbi:hypothetical protein OGAPHI_003697 [Ogataea philodendri]|uniref:Nucleoporin Nup54 alpha-helical domain-containing protein n=1 Tax=Ogataea philodendri TaxID=1378263 RepID=A0A9P8T536_9ASCO|nr:uncharacterized protein OGAPHI_003697 [Ogataea philodendri]KAH3665511.1 hypothetical protein OGAPHI_003697 [Ogataea philodendri]